MYRNLFLLVCIAGFFFCACNNAEQTKQPVSAATSAPSDSSVINKPFLHDFVVNVPRMANTDAIVQLDSILSAASKDSILFHQTVHFLEGPLADPNSRFRNETLHIRILQKVLTSPWYDSLEKIVPQHDLHLALQNRPGNPANDFTYISAAGITKKLYDIEADFTLLFFFNPECPACKDAKTAIMKSEILNKEMASGKLKLLAVYTDTDLAVWKKHLQELPAAWISGHDQNGELYAKSTYNLKAIPSMYLLDKNKIVLLKDCTSVPLIEQRITEAN